MQDSRLARYRKVVQRQFRLSSAKLFLDTWHQVKFHLDRFYFG